MTEEDVTYVRNWTNTFEVGGKFTLQGWKQAHEGDKNAPRATVIGGRVVVSLEADPPDARLDFIGLTDGPAKGGGLGPKTGSNAQWYVRIK